MKTISATDLRVKFTDILKDLDSGPVHITKHGKVIAVLNAPNSVLDAPVGSDPSVDPYETYEPSESDPDAYEDDYEEDEEEGDDWDLSMDSDFERYLSRQCRWTDLCTRFFGLDIVFTRKGWTSSLFFCIMYV